MSYFKLYSPEGIHSDRKKCTCGNCDAYPELFHANTVVDEIPTSISRAKNLQAKNIGSVLIEWHGELGFPQIRYTNLNTGITWRYNGVRWCRTTTVKRRS